MNKTYLLVILASLFLLPLSAGSPMPTVAIVADTETLSQAGPQIERYAASIREGGKNTVIIEDVWQHPDSIRCRLKSLFDTAVLEGAVLIGDIPVPMVRDAQHLCTAFKMDQRQDWKRSSVPSDRFYDDFDLRFDYLKQDGDQPLYHYYSLRADSPQYISCDIYSARIKAPVIPGKSKYEAMRECLDKIADQKESPRSISDVLYFAGHGYNSDSYRARTDENWALRHHFPRLDRDGRSKLSFINFSEDKFIKDRLKAALADDDLDVAILHHHGSDDTQFLNNTPYTNVASQYIEYAKMFFRSKVRGSKDTTATKQYYVREYEVPESWVEGAFDPKLKTSDELFSASMDMAIPDTYGFQFNARFVMLDACYNGSFHLDDYIAGHYIFNPGRTVAVKGNSVNTLQDTWTNEMIGLLDQGVCIGNWAKEALTLESHLIGDPTYRFTAADGGLNLDRSIVTEKHNPKFWRKLMKSATPDVKCLAMVMLARNGAIASAELLDILENDPSPVVRLEAFNLMKKYLKPELTDAVMIALGDNYELLVRLASIVAVKSGDERILPHLASMYFDPTTSERVDFQIRQGFDQYTPEQVRAVFETCRADSPYWPSDSSYERFLRAVERSAASGREDFDKLSDEGLTFRNRRNIIAPQRNKCQVKYLDDMFGYLAGDGDKETKLLVAETLGWFVYSAEKDRIVDFLNKRIAVEADPDIANEMKKTVNRLCRDFGLTAS